LCSNSISFLSKPCGSYFLTGALAGGAVFLGPRAGVGLFGGGLIGTRRPGGPKGIALDLAPAYD